MKHHKIFSAFIYNTTERGVLKKFLEFFLIFLKKLLFWDKKYSLTDICLQKVSGKVKKIHALGARDTFSYGVRDKDFKCRNTLSCSKTLRLWHHKVSLAPQVSPQKGVRDTKALSVKTL